MTIASSGREDMKEKKSVYKCPVCGEELGAEAGGKQVCSYCRVRMQEVSKGIITK